MIVSLLNPQNWYSWLFMKPTAVFAMNQNQILSKFVSLKILNLHRSCHSLYYCFWCNNLKGLQWVHMSIHYQLNKPIMIFNIELYGLKFE